MNVAVIGSRGFNDYVLLSDTLDHLNISRIISGGARGADGLAELYAEVNGIETTIYEAKWEEYGKAAGMIRNRLIIQDADMVVAFWDGTSPGTKNSIDLSNKLKKQIIVINS